MHNRTDTVTVIIFNSQKKEGSSDHPALYVILLLNNFHKIKNIYEREAINLIQTHLTTSKGRPRPSSRSQVGVSDVRNVGQNLGL